ncbi:PTS family mannose fructose sorbose porter component IIB [Liquorilactobacillus vini DSM 20605]|uniref:PTS family mannose fructose sorbose porter component IIB n=1 Tax=Liquorilactobacillus vini DSM 20605 TaxID=1133569 RepID=A0A0R2BX70_9LACO|nr:PTS family mannose fructose sorbose porter component IIB [Liquorilactobacillus vini DSM 20605]
MRIFKKKGEIKVIQLLRVDHRLLHGQVVFSWCSQLNPNCILIADDNIVNDSVRISALRLGKPNDTKLVIKNVSDSISAINSGKTDKYNLIIIVPNIEEAVTLAKNVKQITSINLGGTKANKLTHPISNMVNVTDEEEKLLREVIGLGKEVYIQAVPSEQRREFK